MNLDEIVTKFFKETKRLSSESSSQSKLFKENCELLEFEAAEIAVEAVELVDLRFALNRTSFSNLT